jgi:hypothetical protein
MTDSFSALHRSNSSCLRLHKHLFNESPCIFTSYWFLLEYQFFGAFCCQLSEMQRTVAFTQIFGCFSNFRFEFFLICCLLPLDALKISDILLEGLCFWSSKPTSSLLARACELPSDYTIPVSFFYYPARNFNCLIYFFHVLFDIDVVYFISMKLTTQLHPVPILRTLSAVSLLPARLR